MIIPFNQIDITKAKIMVTIQNLHDISVIHGKTQFSSSECQPRSLWFATTSCLIGTIFIPATQPELY